MYKKKWRKSNYFYLYHYVVTTKAIVIIPIFSQLLAAVTIFVNNDVEHHLAVSRWVVGDGDIVDDNYYNKQMI